MTVLNSEYIHLPCSTYRYTPQQIEALFASNNGQEEYHTLEDSICRPLIGQHRYKPYFYYCTDPKVENINLKSIEDHIRLKDPENHKAKLLEIIQEEKIEKYENKNGQDIIIKI